MKRRFLHIRYVSSYSKTTAPLYLSQELQNANLYMTATTSGFETETALWLSQIFINTSSVSAKSSWRMQFLCNCPTGLTCGTSKMGSHLQHQEQKSQADVPGLSMFLFSKRRSLEEGIVFLLMFRSYFTEASFMRGSAFPPFNHGTITFWRDLSASQAPLHFTLYAAYNKRWMCVI